MLRICLALAAITLSWTGAMAQCEHLPAIDQVLRQHPDWKVTDNTTLTPEDRQLWHKYRGKLCPGIAEGHFSDQAHLEYAVAFQRIVSGRRQGMLVLFNPERFGNRYRVISEWQPDEGVSPSVVWKAPAGPTEEVETNRKTYIRTDSIIYEVLESGAEQFYFSQGKLRHIVTSE